MRQSNSGEPIVDVLDDRSSVGASLDTVISNDLTKFADSTTVGGDVLESEPHGHDAVPGYDSQNAPNAAAVSTVAQDGPSDFFKDDGALKFADSTHNDLSYRDTGFQSHTDGFSSDGDISTNYSGPTTDTGHLGPTTDLVHSHEVHPDQGNASETDGAAAPVADSTSNTPVITDATTSNTASSSATIEAAQTPAPAPPPSESAPVLAWSGDLGSTIGSDADNSLGFTLGNASGGGTSSGTTGTIVQTNGASAGLVIDVVYDSSVANAPTGFTTAVNDVVAYYESHFTNPVTITIDVGYGEVGGQALESGALGESETALTSVSYNQLETALTNNANAIGDSAAAASLSATSPVSGATYYMATAEAEALGISGASANVNGYAGFSSVEPFSYNDANGTGVAANTYDFFGTVAHEFSEIMGRQMLDGDGGYSLFEPLDLFHYSAPGVRDFSGTTAGYASLNGGTTNLDSFNTNSGGDFGDWAGSAGQDSFLAFSGGGAAPVTAADLALMNALGWQPAASATASPSVTSVVESPSSGDLGTGKTVTLTLNMSEAVTVSGGTPTLTLNDGGTATYDAAHSTTTSLAFDYTAAAGQNTSALAATAVNLQSATVTDSSGNAANFSFSGLVQTGPQIDTIAPTVASVAAAGSGITNGAGDLSAGHVVTLTVNLSEAVTVANGAPTLTLNDGGTATYAGGSGTNALTFSYTVAAGQNTPDLAVTGVNLGTATVIDAAGNAANLSAAVTNPAGTLQIDTTAPTVTSVAQSFTGNDLDAGKSGTLTLNASEAVTVAGGAPTLTLNDGGTATYDAAHSTATSLTFDYTVAAGQNTSSLAAASVNLNAASITDAAGNAANLALTALSQNGPQIDTTAPSAPVIANDATNTNNTVTLNGTAEANSTVTVYDGQVLLGTTTANAGGNWSYATGTLATGTQSFTAVATDAAGNTSAASVAIDPFVGQVTSPTISSFSPDSGVVGDGITNATSVTLSGAALANSMVAVFDGSTELGTASANASGAWNFTTGTLANGSHSFTATDTVAGSVSTASASMTVTVDTVAPVVTAQLAHDTGTSSTDNITSNPALSGTAQANSVVTLSEGSTVLGTTTANASGAWSFTPSGLAQGTQTVTASETDVAGNTGTASLTFTLDSVTPSVTAQLAHDTGTSSTDNITSNPALSGTAQANSVVTLSEGSTVLGTTTANASGAWSFTPSGLAQGTQTVTASETDVAGNTGTASLTFTLDSVPPAVTIGLVSDTGASSTDNITSNPALSGTAQANSVVTLSEGSTVLGTTTANASGAWSFTPSGLAQGTQTVTASETDVAGNTGTASLTFTLDPTASTGPTVTSVVATGGGITAGAGDLNVGNVVTLTLNMSQAVAVTGGTPTLTLNDGGVATYTSGSGTNALNFSYTVAAGQNTTALAVTTVNLNSATVTNNIPGTVTAGSGGSLTDANGHVWSFGAGGAYGGSVILRDGVQYAGGAGETLNLVNGNVWTETAQSYWYMASASGWTQEPTGPATATTAIGGGQAANFAGALATLPGPLQVDTTTASTGPTVTSVVATGGGITAGAGDLNVGNVVTLTLNMSQAVAVTGGTPTLTLNDGGVATYTSGSGTNALNFSYTVAAGQNTTALAVTTVNLNSATVTNNIPGTVTAGSGGSLTDANGHVWSFGAGGAYGGSVILRDGVQYAGGAGETLNLVNGNVWTETAQSYWYMASASGWTQEPTGPATATTAIGGGQAANFAGALATLPGPLQVDTITPPISNLLDTVTAGSGGSLTDANGHVWSFGAGGASGGYAILCDGVQYAGGSGVTLNLVNGAIWTENAQNYWYVAGANGWTWEPTGPTTMVDGSQVASSTGELTTLGGSLQASVATTTQIETWNPDGTIHDIHYYGITGQAYTDYDVVYGANNEPVSATFSNGMRATLIYNNDGTLHEQAYEGITGQNYTSTDTIYGANNTPTSEIWTNGVTTIQTETWAASGTIHDIHYYGVTDQAYTDYDVVYGANSKPAVATYSNGMTDTYAYNGDGSLHEQVATGITGQNYTTTDTLYGASNTPVSEVWSNGGTTMQTEAWNANGTIADIHYYDITGQSYADEDVVYGANNKPAIATYSNGMTETDIYNSSGTLHEQVDKGITGENYTSTDTVYGTNNTPVGETWSNGSTTVQTETWNADGTTQVTNPSGSYVTGPTGSTIAGGTGNTVLDGSAGNVNATAGNGGAQVLIGGQGDILTGGNTADTFVFHANMGNETINNFNTAKDVIDIPTAEAANFAALLADMHAAGADAVIAFDAHDALTVSHVATQNLTAQNFHFVV